MLNEHVCFTHGVVDGGSFQVLTGNVAFLRVKVCNVAVFLKHVPAVGYVSVVNFVVECLPELKISL